MALPPEVAAVSAYVRSLALQKLLRSRRQIERYQRRAIQRTIDRARLDIAFYRNLAADHGEVPKIDKAMQQADFEQFNRASISVEDIVAAIAAGRDTVDGFFVGQSTGTSGNRGRFVISPAERFTWLGTIVAKAIPDVLVRPRKVALALPGLSALYRSAATGGRIQLGFFDLTRGVEAWRDAFVHFAPGQVVAPPKVLRHLAEEGALDAVEAFSGAEVLDPLDRAIIEHATGRPVREIYMATEGLFGVACRYGTLHLAEDVMHFEWEAVSGTNLVVPVITDLVRRVQPMIRYRMNDMLELSSTRCRCGSAYQAVAQVHGRLDDVFQFETAGRAVTVTPDVLRNAVVDADPRIRDFRITQKIDGAVIVALEDHLPDEAHRAARASVERALARLGANVQVRSERGTAPRLDRKLRRVERERA